MLTLGPDEDAEVLRVDLWSQDEQGKEKEKTPKEQLEDYEPEEEAPEGQVVRSPPSDDDRKPDDSKFLAEQDSRVDKETKARIQTPGDDRISSLAETQSKGRDPQTMPGGMRAEDHTVAPMLDDNLSDEGSRNAAQPRAPPSPLDVNLQPSMHAMASAIVGSGLDYIENVDPGEMTALNTRGWQFASFFNRVKRQVEQYWHPDKEYRKHDPYGNIYGFKDRVTVLLVVLRADGSLKHVYVMSPSGAKFLDTEASEALSQAAPFPNVPVGLRDKNDGLVKFTFHFLVDVGGQPIFRMRRYR
jgi:protein TonB